MHDFMCTCTTGPSRTFELSKSRTYAVHAMIGSSLPSEVNEFTRVLARPSVHYNQARSIKQLRQNIVHLK